MIQQLSILTLVIVLAGGVQPGHAQPGSSPPTSQAGLDEVSQLDKLAEKLYKEGKFGEAVPIVERVLALREKALGPMHPDVAESLNNLAGLYRDQGAYPKAEPLWVRALDIREKALGPMHPAVARSLNNLALLYWAQGAYPKAEPLYVRALDIREKTLGPMHPDVAQSLSNLAWLYQDQGAYPKAEPLYVRALDIREKVFGAMHPDVAESLNDLAEAYRAQGKNGKAEPLLVRALDIREKVLGPMHPDVAESLNNLALLYRVQGAYGKAEPLLVHARDIREKVRGPNPEVATSLNNLASLYKAQGLYGKAEPLYIRALDIREKMLGPMHRDVAAILNNLAGLYQAQGLYGKAEPLYGRALDIHEKLLGPMHRDVAAILNNLAGLYQAQGTYGKSESLLVRALDIHEKVLGPIHSNVATSLNSLSSLYMAQGAYGKAEPLLARALDIQEKVLGAMHPALATSLNNLASLYQTQGAYGKAEPLYVRALDICEKVLGPTHPVVAMSLTNLAWLYECQGAYGKAEPLYVRALDICEKALGPMHPDVATSLHSLARLYRTHGAYEKAEPLFVRALDIREKALGPMHPDLARTLNNLADLYRMQGAYESAEPLYVRAAEIQEEQLRIELAHLSEPRKRALMNLLQTETFSLVSLHADAMPSSENALELALTTILRRKGRILDSIVDNDTALRAHLTPKLRDQLDQLTRARTQLIAQLYAPTDPRSTTNRTAITTARARVDDLESALSAGNAEFHAQSELATVAKIQAVLPRGTALVEFVRYRRLNPRQTRRWEEERYIAYLLTLHGPPQWVALGEAAPIDAEVDAVLAAMDSKVPTETTKVALQRLDALVFAPIRTRLTGVSHVILAPDGKLNLVPFEALVDPQGHYALERYLVSYVTTGRDLLRFAAPHNPRSSAVIVAGPDYGPLPSPGGAGAVSFTPLAGALAEATDLQRYFPTAPLTGGKATKSALAALTGPSMLHIATHGFYARDPGTASTIPTPATRAATSAPRAPPPLAGSAWFAQRDPSRGMVVESGAWPLLPPPRFEDPTDGLDRAGLAMAGANQGADGIVTARELAGFDWWGTQLVVLSACQTGVGAVPSGDGVYGMRRALVLAGAESQVVTLWNVNDSSARVLMRDYYDELARGTGRAEALRRAKLHMLHQPRYAHPYYWAAFIPAGNWRPLDKNTIRPQRRTP